MSWPFTHSQPLPFRPFSCLDGRGRRAGKGQKYLDLHSQRFFPSLSNSLSARLGKNNQFSTDNIKEGKAKRCLEVWAGVGSRVVLHTYEAARGVIQPNLCYARLTDNHREDVFEGKGLKLGTEVGSYCQRPAER